jgi:hypothetical protein
VSLSHCFPQPMPAQLGGQTYLASELRLRDLAQLEAWAIASLGSPLEGLGDDASAEDLRAAWLAAEKRPALGSPEVDASVFTTIDGRGLFALLVLRDDPRKLTADLARQIATQASAEEWERVDRIAFAIVDGDFLEVVRRVDRLLGLPSFAVAKARGKTVPWAKAIAEAVEIYHLSPAQIGELTLGQWRILRSGGECLKLEEPLPADGDLEDRVMTVRGEFWAGHQVAPDDSTEDLRDDEGEVEDDGQ